MYCSIHPSIFCVQPVQNVSDYGSPLVFCCSNFWHITISLFLWALNCLGSFSLCTPEIKLPLFILSIFIVLISLKLPRYSHALSIVFSAFVVRTPSVATSNFFSICVKIATTIYSKYVTVQHVFILSLTIFFCVLDYKCFINILMTDSSWKKKKIFLQIFLTFKRPIDYFFFLLLPPV